MKRFGESIILIAGTIVLSGIMCLFLPPTSVRQYFANYASLAFVIVAAALVIYYKPWRREQPKVPR